MTGMSTGQKAASRRWLLPQERWFNRVMSRREADPPRPEQARFQQNYGPDGDLFFTAAGIDILVGLGVGLPGALLAGIAGHGLLAAIGYWMFAIAALSVVVGFIRTFQASRAGKAFRAGRPFIRATRR
jgi:hypothetical protein